MRCIVRPERWYLATASANLVARVCCASCNPLEGGKSCVDGNTYSLLLLDLGLTLSASLLLRLALLEKGLGDEDVVLGGDGTKHVRLVRGPAYQRYEVERRWRTAAQVRHSLVADSIDSLV